MTFNRKRTSAASEEALALGKEVEKYTYYDDTRIKAAYVSGDIYSNRNVLTNPPEWDIGCRSGDRPYLTHIKQLSGAWPHLRQLADFMEVSTSPRRWDDSKYDLKKNTIRDERASRTNVAQLDFFEAGKPVRTNYETSDALKAAFEAQRTAAPSSSRDFRLFVVEDLSRDVIEYLGAQFDIEPAFFREHIYDLTWYNVRDREVYPPQLNMITRKQNWLQLSFTRARYFESPKSFKQGTDKANGFNVTRTLEDDRNNTSKWDDQKAMVGLLRTKASFWLPAREPLPGQGRVGVLLVDPTIKEGFPLWNGYHNWEEPPSVHNKKPPSHGPPSASPGGSFFEDLIYWAQKQTPSLLPNFSEPSSPGSSTSEEPTSRVATLATSVDAPFEALLHLVCAEWLTISEYIRTRLVQTEWEVSFPEHFLPEPKGDRDPTDKSKINAKGKHSIDTKLIDNGLIDSRLEKLHIWRRLVPLYREMLTETIDKVRRYQCNAGGFSRKVTSTAATKGATKSCQCQPTEGGCIDSFRDEFIQARSYMEDHQARIDRLTTVVTSRISIDDSRRGLEDSRLGREDNANVARLTWLATFFIPLSFIAGLFSMAQDLSVLGSTFRRYFEVAIPLALLSMAIAYILTVPSVTRYFEEERWKWWRGDQMAEKVE